jgi:hypothetical protein
MLQNLLPHFVSVLVYVCGWVGGPFSSHFLEIQN